MSQRNVELVRSSYEAYARGEVGEAVGMLHPSVEWVMAEEHPDARTLHGREAIFAYRREWLETLEGMHVEMERIVDAGEAVVTVGTVRGSGVGSGVDVEVRIALLYTFEDGAIVRVQEFIQPADALRAAGLPD